MKKTGRSKTAGHKGWLYVLGFFLLILGFDQWTKFIILDTFASARHVIEVTSFFNIVLVYNKGVSFGLFAMDSQVLPYVLIGFSLLIAGGIVYWVLGQSRRMYHISGGLIAGGACGNSIDRLHQPGVVDFLDFHIGGYHWPAFNVADSAIVLGVVFLIIDSLLHERQQGK